MILSGSLRTTTPDQKSKLRTRKHFEIKTDMNEQFNGMTYLNEQNMIASITTKKHTQPLQKEQQNISRLRRSISPLNNSQLGRNLVPKIDNTPRTPQKSRVFANVFNNSCSFENINLTQCQLCKSHNKENIDYQPSPIKMTQSILRIEPLTQITSKGNYYKK